MIICTYRSDDDGYDDDDDDNDDEAVTLIFYLVTLLWNQIKELTSIFPQPMNYWRQPSSLTKNEDGICVNICQQGNYIWIIKSPPPG